MLDRERFFRGIHEVLHRAFVAAATRESPFIGTEHLLLGVLDVERKLFDALRVDTESLLAQLELRLAAVPRYDSPSGRLPFTPRHLLAGLAELRDGATHEVLAEFDLDANAVRIRLGLKRPSAATREQTARHRSVWERGVLPRVLEAARARAHEWGTPEIGTEHVLVALLEVAREELAPLLGHFGVDAGTLASRVAESVAHDTRKPEGELVPFTDAMRGVLEAAFRESRGRRAEEIAPGVLLWALATSDEGSTRRLLRDDFGIDPVDLWARL